MADKIFAQGIIFKRPTANAPEFVKGKVSFKVEEAIAFLKEHVNANGWVDLDLKQSKEGNKLYLELNTWKSASKTAPKIEEGEANPEDVPF